MDDKEIKWETLLRLRLIEIVALWDGRLTTNHLCASFGIKRQQASRDINQYQELTDSNLVYDARLKGYRPSPSFSPKFTQGVVDEYLQMLDSHSLLEHSGIERIDLPSTPTFALKAPPRRTSPEIVRGLVEACRKGLRVEISYASMTSPSGEERIIAPHAIVSSGYRWHVRAYCEKHGDYRDFLLGRVIEFVDFVTERINDPEEDDLWHEHITLRLIPHPGLNPAQQQLIAMERCMTDGVLEVTTRKATAIYMLQLLQVPTENTDHAKANPVVLENLDEIAELRFGKKK